MKHSKGKIEAICTWGEGPDVLLSFEDFIFILYEPPIKGHYVHGVVRNGSTDLTVEEAEKLAYELLTAAKQARELDESYEKYMRKENETS